MRILVTGSTGFVGRNLVEFLSKIDEHSVIAHSRSMSDELPAAVQHFYADADHSTDWSEALSGVDVVIHLAARAHKMSKRQRADAQAFFDVNVALTRNLAEQAKSAGVRRFIFMSSVGAQGMVTTGVALQPNHPPRPATPYGESKLAAEEAVREICDDGVMEYVIVRAPLVYGPDAPGNFGRLVRTIIDRRPLPLGALRTNRRSFVYVGNLVDLVSKCVWYPCARNEVFLVSDGEDISTADLVERIAKLSDVRSPMFFVPAKLLRIFFSALRRKEIAQSLIDSLEIDITHTKDVLSWVPPFSLDAGLYSSLKRFD